MPAHCFDPPPARAPVPERRPGPRWRQAPASLLGLAAVLTLAGCASAPPAVDSARSIAALTAGAYANTEAQDANGPRAAPDAQALAVWWQQFDDPLLTQLVEQTLAHNSSLRVARATLREARATRATTEADTRPQLGASGSAARNRAAGTSGNSFNLGLDASWEPDFSGAQSAGVSAAGYDEQGAAADLSATQVSVAAEVGLAYVQLRGAEARLRITQASAASFAETYDLARWRLQAGLGSSLDLEQSRLNLEQTRAGLPALATEIAQDQSQLALLTGQRLEAVRTLLQVAPVKVSDTTGGGAQSPGVPTADAAMQRLAIGLPADLLRQRPDLRSAEMAVRAQWARLDQARRNTAPSLSLSGSLGLQAATLGALSGPGAGLASLAAAVSWPLLDGGRRQAVISQQDAALERSHASYEAAVLTALKDVEDNLVALRDSRVRLAALQLASDAADNALLLTRHEHSAGLVDFATLLEAERNALSARTSLQTTLTDRSLSLIGLFKALGGGWSPEDPRLAEPVADASPDTHGAAVRPDSQP